MLRKQPLVIIGAIFSIIVFITLLSRPSQFHKRLSPFDVKTSSDIDVDTSSLVDQSVIKGKPIMSKMKNETIRAELGRSAWKVFHTILAQYPIKPTPEERQTLSSYIHLFSRVYPCRECAEHFQQLLVEFPPQTASREIASQWGCHVHNQVNKRLEKPVFDCMELSDKYACGCGDEENEKADIKMEGTVRKTSG